MYRVIYPFSDLQDSNYAYCVGDIFPRDGMNVNEQRLKELAGEKNQQGRVLIEFVGESATQRDVQTEEKPEYSKTDINRMPVAQLRELAGSNGINGADEMTGAELKKALIDAYGL